MLTIDVKANGFLHHMVRNLAGVLMSIGRREHDEDWALEVLEAKDRALAGVTAPAQGLYFMAVDYDEKYAINRFGVLEDDDTH
jgi:tRNA pseudouridine38-40 synthase